MAFKIPPRRRALMARSVFNNLLFFAEKMAPSLPLLTIPDKVNHFHTGQVKIWSETGTTHPSFIKCCSYFIITVTIINWYFTICLSKHSTAKISVVNTDGLLTGECTIITLYWSNSAVLKTCWEKERLLTQLLHNLELLFSVMPMMI